MCVYISKEARNVCAKEGTCSTSSRSKSSRDWLPYIPACSASTPFLPNLNQQVAPEAEAEVAAVPLLVMRRPILESLDHPSLLPTVPPTNFDLITRLMLLLQL